MSRPGGPPPASQEGISSIPQPQEPSTKPTPQQKEEAEKTNVASSKSLPINTWIQGKIKAKLPSKLIIGKSRSETPSGPNISKMIEPGKRQGTISIQKLLSKLLPATLQPHHLSRNNVQLTPDVARKQCGTEQDIRANWMAPNVNLFDLRFSNLESREPLNIARNALKEALKTNPRNPEKALEVFAKNKEWKKYFDPEGIKKILSDAWSNPEIFEELTQEIAVMGKIEATRKEEQPKPPSRRSLPKKTQRPIPAKPPTQTQKLSQIHAPPNYAHYIITLINKMEQPLKDPNFKKENIKGFLDNFEAEEHPELNLTYAEHEKLLGEAKAYLIEQLEKREKS